MYCGLGASKKCIFLIRNPRCSLWVKTACWSIETPCIINFNHNPVRRKPIILVRKAQPHKQHDMFNIIRIIRNPLIIGNKAKNNFRRFGQRSIKAKTQQGGVQDRSGTSGSSWVSVKLRAHDTLRSRLQESHSRLSHSRLRLRVLHGDGRVLETL